MNDSTKARLAYQLRQAQRPGHNVTAAELASLQSLRIQALGEELADVRVDNDRLHAEARKASLTVAEPLTYGPHSRFSWFVDVFKAERSGGTAGDIRKRLDAHTREMQKIGPQRAESRNWAARAAAQRALAAGPAERRALEAFTAAGHVIFERRALTQVDGAGGYAIPPAWLIDRAVPAARADSALAAAVTTLPLPKLCDSVNIPAVRTGTAAGVQPAGVSPPTSRDLADAFVSSTVVTVAGYADVASIWLDQGAGGAGGNLDAIIWDDLQADARLTLDGLLILGSGASGQTTGLLPPPVAIGTSLAPFAPNGNTSSGQQWYYNGGTGTALGTTVAQAISGVTRARGKRPTHLLTHPWVWDQLTAMTDQQDRPYVLPKGPHPVPDDAQCPPGVVGHAHGLPILGDLNVPVTVGNAYPNAPFLGTVNGAQYAGQPGTGSYTPVLPVVADDLFVFTGEPRMQLLREVLAGSLGYRFQLRQYVAIIVNRYQALTSGTLPNSGGWAAGACTSYGVVTGSNSLLSRTGQGF